MARNRIVHNINSLNMNSRKKLIGIIGSGNISFDNFNITHEMLEKDRILHGIIKYFGYHGFMLDDGKTSYSDFREQISSKISYEPLKMICFGMHSFSESAFQFKDLPREYVRNFIDHSGWGKWALLYLFGGMMNNPQDSVDLEKSTYDITASLISNGMSGVVHWHNQSSDKKYIKASQVPYASKIFKGMPGLDKILKPSFTQSDYLIEKKQGSGKPLM